MKFFACYFSVVLAICFAFFEFCVESLLTYMLFTAGATSYKIRYFVLQCFVPFKLGLGKRMSQIKFGLRRFDKFEHQVMDFEKSEEFNAADFLG